MFLRFEINLSNENLFNYLSLHGHELIKGRLFTTRMPRQLPSILSPVTESTSSSSSEIFKLKCKNNNLSSVVILTHKEEYMKYAGGDLETFYCSIPVEVITRPITDFSVPTEDGLIATIKVRLKLKILFSNSCTTSWFVSAAMLQDVLYRLADGKNVLVHCAGGNGRTGLVIAGVVKSLGISGVH